MRKILIYNLLLLCFTNCIRLKQTNDAITEKTSINTNRFKNNIDDLKTTKEVVAYVKSLNLELNKKTFGQLQIKSIDTVTKDLIRCEVIKGWNIQNWEKTDLNNDGKTDLIFIAYWPYQYSQYAIVDKGNSNFDLVLISNELNYCKLVKPIKIDKKTELLLYDFRTQIERTKNDSTIHFIDTLTYRFDSFVEKNPIKKRDYDIESIKFNMRYYFTLEIDSQENAYYNCPEKIFMNPLYENIYVGKSSKKIPIKKFNELEKLLKYIDVKNLSNMYEIDHTDYITTILTIKFKDGSIKEITDYGSDGSYGLNATYSKLIKIATETNWK
ncbi:DUF6438 domain-containing protein [Flavobacterium frigoris]|uniref:DUF6438 domain-containing protein n=1 Tax=Flavobacterium frigoris TaxID=229204 RepID=A0A1H9CJK6_FLAFI|nr:hypothetical protein [Flavobacterium frigoris]SEQ00788.1 hypothetical protein SAMN05444355_101179 [Flavobacterium frigoris]